MISRLLISRLLAAALCAVILAPAAPASAQELGALPVPAVEVSAGYAFMRDTTMEENFPAGWYFAAGTNLNRWFGLTGEVTGAHKTFNEEPFFRLKANLYTFMGGPRFFVKRGRFMPFAQVLAGAAHLRSKVTLPGQGISDMRENDTEFALQPGGGLGILLTRNVGLRTAVDYRRIMFFEDGEEDNSEVRVLAGVVFAWGAR